MVTAAHRRDGEQILLWCLPALGLLWLSAFLLFPGFVEPMSPKLSADEVAAFYRDPANLPRIRYSMILFNWFGVAFIPVLALIALQVWRMGHRTPILTFCIVCCAAGGPTLFLIADLFWLLAAFRPERDAQLILMFNDLAWLTFTSQVGYLIAQNIFLAMAIFLDRNATPVFPRWVAYFNLAAAIPLLPAGFTALAQDGPLAWDGWLSFWAKNVTIGVWIVVMGVALARSLGRQRRAEGASA